MAIKSKELAGMLGVSAATMSLVLNHKPGISEELRNSLLERIREMGYGYMIRDEEEREEREDFGPDKTIAYVVLSEYHDDVEEAAFFPKVIEGAEREARKSGYRFTILHMYDESGEKLRDSVGKEQFAGMLVYAAHVTDRMKEALDALEVPYLLIDCFCPAVDASAVTINNRQGILAAVDYLYKRGHRRIGYVSSGRQICSLMERRKSFRYAMEEIGLEEDPAFCVEKAGTGQRAQEYLEELWKDARRVPTALLVENDVMAISVYRALKNNGLRIPEDVSVIGFDGRSICSMLEPPLTTLRVPRRLMGRLLVMLLLQKIELQSRVTETVTVRLEINAELVEMESVSDAK
ncbi:MAG TPA: LacI family transcriptional regulator [Candidatus Eisenbergiella merdavium]|uniref:LacI family transcriptional regulator n=2 Tax=Eisenbergiella TaxID=1432051 RepID=A0A9D2NGR6_9FIRM|nr:LacI family transcriptional regulator [Candidatus Eisenbergiella merdavium]